MQTRIAIVAPGVKDRRSSGKKSVALTVVPEMAETGSSGRGRFLRAALFLFLVLGLFGCDHATKIAAKASLEGSAAVPIAPEVLRGTVELRYAQNDDVAFSALSYQEVMERLASHRATHPSWFAYMTRRYFTGDAGR